MFFFFFFLLSIIAHYSYCKGAHIAGFLLDSCRVGYSIRDDAFKIYFT